MVTKHFFSILLGCLTALCITSCLGSDDDANNSSKGLSKAEIAQCYLTVGGNYSGDLLYFSKSDDGLQRLWLVVFQVHVDAETGS